MLDIAANALTTGIALNVASSSSDMEHGLVKIVQTGSTTTQEEATLQVSTSATTHASAGIALLTGDALTVGKAVAISADALTTGSALDITSSSANKTSGGLVNIAQTGVSTAQTEPTLTVSTSATTQGAVASFTGDSLTTSDAVSVSADALTTGSALDITSSSSAKTTGGLVNIAQTGATTSQEAATLTVSTSATTHADAGAALLTGDAMTVGNVVAISADALTTGSALDITSSSANKTSGGLVNIAQTGVSTAQTAPTLTVATSATTHGEVASFTGNSLTTSNAVEISATALTTGAALHITTNTANAKALEIASGFMVMTPQTITIANGGSTASANLNFFESSVIFIDMNDTKTSDTYIRVVKDGGGNTSYEEGQICHIFYDTEGAALKLDFTSNQLCSGSGDARYLTFTSTGQSATIIHINSKWWIINTGAGVS